MRVGILADIHGNGIALDAVLADARSAGVDGWWILGDLAAIGPEPVPVLERLAGLGHVRVIRGNTDRYIVTGERPPPALDTVRERPELAEILAHVAASFAWTRGYVTACGWMDWLERLPVELRETAPSGRRILAVHASPGTDDGEGIHPACGNERIAMLLDGCNADVVFVAHTHEPMVRRVGDVVVANVGSVSNPFGEDRRASWVLLEMDASGMGFEHRRVAYDVAAFEDSVHRSRHPTADYILSFQRGARPARTPHPDHTPLAPYRDLLAR